MCVECITRYRVGPEWWAGRTFVLVCGWIWTCYPCSMWYEIVISPWCAVQLHYNDNDRSICAHVRWMYGMVSCWSCTNRRKCVRIGVCLDLKVLLVFDIVLWGRWKLSFAFDIHWIDDTASFGLSEARQRMTYTQRLENLNSTLEYKGPSSMIEYSMYAICFNMGFGVV